MSEQQMPARIWVGRHTGWAAFEMRGDTAYIKADIAERMAEALEALVANIEDYERINNLSPSPGKADCWQSVTHAKAALSAFRSATQDTEAR